MDGNETRKGERQETMEELSLLLSVAQGMGRRLAYETHGDGYALVGELNMLLHRSREALVRIQTTASAPPNSLAD